MPPAGTPAALKPAQRFTFEASQEWGVSAPDDYGGVAYRNLRQCDEIVSVSAALVDTLGNPVTTSAELNIFTVPRSVDRRFGLASEVTPGVSGRSVAGFTRLMAQGHRSFMGGFAYAGTEERETTATNFGHGWPVAADWSSVDGRDQAQADVLYILYRVLTTHVASLSASVVFRSCHK